MSYHLKKGGFVSGGLLSGGAVVCSPEFSGRPIFTDLIYTKIKILETNNLFIFKYLPFYFTNLFSNNDFSSEFKIIKVHLF